jgi:hypothetical protein
VRAVVTRSARRFGENPTCRPLCVQQIISAAPSNTTTVHGRLMLTVLGGLAEFERGLTILEDWRLLFQTMIKRLLIIKALRRHIPTRTITAVASTAMEDGSGTAAKAFATTWSAIASPVASPCELSKGK